MLLKWVTYIIKYNILRLTHLSKINFRLNFSFSLNVILNLYSKLTCYRYICKYLVTLQIITKIFQQKSLIIIIIEFDYRRLSKDDYILFIGRLFLYIL